MKIKTSKKTWEVTGMCFVSSDSIYSNIKKCIESGNLSQQHLQNVTGNRAPVDVDIPNRVIAFSSF